MMRHLAKKKKGKCRAQVCGCCVHVSSAHHKCDVSIALDSCTSNKNEKEKKATTGLFSFFLDEV